MKFRASVWIALLAAGCSRAPDAELLRAVEAAESIFSAARSPEDYLKAAGMYERLIRDRPNDPGLLYNQANAFYLAGRKADAIAGYRRALRFLPRDENLRANLVVAAGDDAFPRANVVESVMFWQNTLSYWEKGVLMASLATLACVLAAARWRFGQAWPAMKTAAIVLAALAAVMACSTAYDFYRYEVVRHGVVGEPNVFARTGPGENYPQEFAVPAGLEFEVLEQRPGSAIGILIRMPDGATGWIAAAVVY